jgi:hypothetical protein
MAGTFDEVFTWIDMARDRDWYSPHTARQIKTAVRRTQDAIGDNKFSNLDDLMQALPSLFNSWQRSRNGSASTARSYESRMRSLIREFMKWKDEPKAYEAARDTKDNEPAPKKGGRRKKAAPAKKRAAPKRAASKRAAPKRTRRAPRAAKVPEPAPEPAAPVELEAGVSGSARSQTVSLDNIFVDIRWDGEVSPAELASVLAALAQCRPESGKALLHAASEIF